ncbi:MAG TPA: PEGA domain-containing protein [Kofleriaceae bacterium]|nr:PEGA domain-containing protein [Kofleriaceae bacterium]
MDQFVATFHRFCGDDQTFFVATLTSRPVGLETAFSIQLADKQPVLRGLCVVLDAWATADNRFKRPGIRLGIKRLTADSQLVFDRLRAASRAPDTLGAEAIAALTAVAAVEATPPPGTLPTLPPLPRLVPRVASGPVTLPRLPPMVKPGVVTVPAKPEPVKLEPVAPPPPSPAVPEAIAAPPPAPVAGSEAAPAGLDLTPPPIEVTRFQVALNVGTIPPPLSDVEFKPQPMPRRPRVTPQVTPDAPPDAPAGEPALIVDKPPVAAAPASPVGPIGAVGREERTPGSSFILPANPLHDLSDESLEGFVDCTLYEDAGGTSGDTWHDELLDVAPSRPSVPAMPYDTPPDLTVRASGDNESLRVAVEMAAVAPPAEPAHDPVPEPIDLASVSGELPEAGRRSMPMPAETGSLAIDPEYAVPISGPIPTPIPTPVPPPMPAPAVLAAPPATDSYDLHAPTGAFAIGAPPPPAPPPFGFTGAPTPPPMPPFGMPTPSPMASQPMPAMAADPHALYTPYPASLPVALPAPPPSNELPAWQRALLIGGTVAVAIVLAFVIALRVRGPRAAPPPAASAPSAVSPHRSQPRYAPHIDGPEAPHAEARGDTACQLSIVSTPTGATVRLDDRELGASPLTVDASCARHKIEVGHARYQSATRWVTLGDGEAQQVEVSLARPVHAVTVTSSPPGAAVLLEGRRVGTTPTVLQVTGFSAVHLTFEKPGYRRVTRRVYSKLAQDAVSVQLAP